MPRVSMLIVGLVFTLTTASRTLVSSAPQISPHDIVSLSSSLSTSAFKAVVPSMHSALIVGFGQAAHGAAESTTSAGNFLKVVAVGHGYRVFAFEGSYGVGQKIDVFIQGGPGDVDALLRDQGEWIWRSAELRSLILWMRGFNSGRPQTQRIHFVGIDPERADPSLRIVETYVAQDAPRLLPATRADVACAYGVKIETYAEQVPARNRVRCAFRLASAVKRLKVAAWPTGRQREHKLCMQALSIAVDSQRIAASVPSRATPARAAQKLFAAAFDIREASMARTAIWSIQFYGGREILLAHNAHVAKEGLYTARSSPLQLHPTGSVLASSLGAQYYALGQSFVAGSILARLGDNAPPKQIKAARDPANDSEELMGGAKLPVFVDFRRASRDTRRWLSRPHYLRDAGSVFDPERSLELYNMGTAFDGLIVISKVSPLTLLPGRP